MKRKRKYTVHKRTYVKSGNYTFKTTTEKTKTTFLHIPGIRWLFVIAINEIRNTHLLKQVTVFKFVEKYYTYIQCREIRRFILSLLLKNGYVEEIEKSPVGKRQFNLIKEIDENDELFSHLEDKGNRSVKDLIIVEKIKEFKLKKRKMSIDKLRKSLKYKREFVARAVRRLEQYQILYKDFSKPRRVKKRSRNKEIKTLVDLNIIIPYTYDVTPDYEAKIIQFYT